MVCGDRRDGERGEFMTNYSEMVRAILTEDVKVLYSIVSKSENVDAFDDTGRTPLHIAVMHARTQAIGPLVEAGADVNLPSGDHKTAAEIADSKGGLVQQCLADAKAGYDNGAAQSAVSESEAPRAKKAGIPIGRKAVEAMRRKRNTGNLVGDLAT